SPDGFVFSVKGPRYATNRKVLSEAGDSIKWFFNSGVLELGPKLGPVLWQFAPTKKFDEADFGGFLGLLPHTIDGMRIRHVVEVPPCQLSHPGCRRSAAQIVRAGGLRRARQIPRDRRSRRRLRLRAAAEGR